MAATYTLTRTIAADEPYDLVVAGGGPAGTAAAGATVSSTSSAPSSSTPSSSTQSSSHSSSPTTSASTQSDDATVTVVVDPADLHWFGGEALNWSAQAVYTITFLIFWSVISVAGALMALLDTRPEQINADRGRHWPR